MYKIIYIYFMQISNKYSICFSCKTNIFLLMENHAQFIQLPKPISHIFFIKSQIHVLYLSCIKYLYKSPLSCQVPLFKNTIKMPHNVIQYFSCKCIIHTYNTIHASTIICLTYLIHVQVINHYSFIMQYVY